MAYKKRLGICGIGVITEFYLTALTNDLHFELTAIADPNPLKQARFCGTSVEVFEDFRELVCSHKLDAVIINLPNDLHFLACREALRAGKHVCCEKPLTLRTHEANELVHLARSLDRTLFTAFHRRYNANVQSALNAVRGQPIERVTAHYLEKIEDHAGADTWYLNPNRSGGGCVADNGPNVFDAVAQFLGPLTVSAAEIETDEKGIDRRARITVRGANGVPADIFLDWSFTDGERKDVIVDLADGGNVTADMLAGFPAFKSSLTHEYEGVLHDFARGIDAGDSFGEDGRAVVHLVEAAYALGSAAFAFSN